MKNKPNTSRKNDLPYALANPAKRALANAGIRDLNQLTKLSEQEVKQLHGIGPNAIKQLRAALKANGLAFANKK
jgi:hypothetical protein